MTLLHDTAAVAGSSSLKPGNRPYCYENRYIHLLCVIHRHRHYRQFAVPEKGLNLFVSLCFFVTTPPLGRPNGKVVLLLTKVSHINPWQVGRTRSHIGTVSFSVFFRFTNSHSLSPEPNRSGKQPVYLPLEPLSRTQTPLQPLLVLLTFNKG